MKTLEERFWSKVNKTDGCWLWTANRRTHASGKWPYGQIRKLINGKWKQQQAHRISWEIHNGAIPAGLWVLHKCDNTLCVNPDHLFIGTAKANTDDMVAKKRSNFYGGSARPWAGKATRLPIQWRVCKGCFQKFVVTRKHPENECCSHRCAQQARVHNPLLPESLASYRKKRGFTPPEPKNCLECQESFTPSRFHRKVVYCSRGCSNRARARGSSSRSTPCNLAG